ncbi:rhodanese-like domain-containing protein [Sphingomonas sp. SUN039]|uniref:rhodanese-like domain-containing protein n=1 Tax=Sphingomonas sp. SUN039 TaxID=2937787 RepID=UPI002164B35A|nr:rhodanese-like domain-containing protein [Sphingomonas sp. SUN039]UVO54487.1 rhodanese-like domain-containing protein [Sphingomonas sp. SUN039]
MLLFVLAVAAAAPAPTSVMTTARQIDYAGFEQLARNVRPLRAKRLVTLDRFKAMAQSGDDVILDARSAEAFARGHIAGAINLPLTDFTAEALAAILADRTRPVLIYCNNNFSNNRRPVAMKAAPVSLNIQTFINLAAYGHRDVYELGQVIDFDDPKVGWVKALG